MKQVKPLKWSNYLWLYGLPTLLNYIACKMAIPYMEAKSSLPIEIIYFICVGGIALAPMFFMAIYFARKEGGSRSWKQFPTRTRIRKLTAKDWLWTSATFIFLCVASFLIAKIIMPEMGMDATPFFFKNMPLDHDHLSILYLWPIFFFFNIFGEELLWRGYIQPRQELQLGKMTWLVHGIFWAIWHLPMGLDLIFAATPIFFILPAVVQIRQNTTIAIVVHAVFGAFGFLAIALGGVH
jgi:membrane protease YdiL (CAAX protease family)